MEYITIDHIPHALQQAVPIDSLKAMCQRAFGQAIHIVSVRELGNGEINNTYLIHMVGHEPIILRVAPVSTAYLCWHEHNLMRREQTLHPFFAPIAPLLPRTLMVDFTHQILDRDYMFQQYMPGELWSTIIGELSPVENDELWHQFARISRTISDIRGESFGLPAPAPHFPTWSLTVLDWLERTIRDATDAQLDTTHIRMLYTITNSHTSLLDEIAQPHLLHGDLWPFNVLVERKKRRQQPSIVAILDADRGSWGDPLADWTFFLLERRVSAHVRTIFWQEFGQPETTLGAQFRAKVYEGLHHGKVLALLKREKKYAVLERAQSHLQDVVVALQSMLGEDVEK